MKVLMVLASFGMLAMAQYPGSRQNYGAPSVSASPSYSAPTLGLSVAEFSSSSVRAAPQQNYGAPQNNYGAPQPSQNYGVAQARQGGYQQQQSSRGGYQQQSSGGYQQQSSGGYQQPQAQAYSAPAQAQAYSAPAQSQAYSAPAQSQAYSTPAQSQGYSAPQQSGGYQRGGSSSGSGSAGGYQRGGNNGNNGRNNGGYNDGPQEQKVHKHVYIHVAPSEAPEPKAASAPKTPQIPEKHYKILFIRTPEPPPYEQPDIIDGPPAPEQKTLVYVLLKKPDATPAITLPTAAPTKPSKPEVYFIRYKSPEGGAGGPRGGEYGAPAGGSPPLSDPSGQYGISK